MDNLRGQRFMRGRFTMFSRAIMLVLMLCCISSCSKEEANKRYKVGLCIVGTGKYDVYAQACVESARDHFCTHHDVTYFVFTDGQIAEAPDVVRIEQPRLGWPYDTLKRFHIYDANCEKLEGMDYLFATDADMRFVGEVGDEILKTRVVVEHPGFAGKKGTYETNPESTACVKKKESKGKTYFAGGFYGGEREEFFRFVRHAKNMVDLDLAKNFIAIWHDESHLNRYFLDNKPSLVLSPSYCYPESWNLPYEKKLLALDKNHAEVRKP
jgi:histo-blood group ABO system transferase